MAREYLRLATLFCCHSFSTTLGLPIQALMGKSVSLKIYCFWGGLYYSSKQDCFSSTTTFCDDYCSRIIWLDKVFILLLSKSSFFLLQILVLWCIDIIIMFIEVFDKFCSNRPSVRKVEDHSEWDLYYKVESYSTFVIASSRSPPTTVSTTIFISHFLIILRDDRVLHVVSWPLV